MTRYDPFSYGQVPLAGRDDPKAPDDLLFADPVPGKPRPAAEADDWAPLADAPATFAATDGGADALAFGEEVLGERRTAPVPATPVAATAAAAPAVAARSRSTATGPAVAVPSLAPARPAIGAGSQPPAPAVIASPAPVGPARNRQRPVTPLPVRPRSPLALAVPFGIAAGGGTLASWLIVMQQNPILGSIVGGAALVGSALAWVSLRG